MSASPAFSSRSDCPIPYVPNIVPDLIQDCVVPPIPEPFFEADIFPPIIPPIPLGCPSIIFSGSLHSGSPLSLSTKFSQQDGIDNCFPILDFDIQIPFICPSMSQRNGAASWSKVAFSPSYRLSVSRTQNSAPWCDYNFDLDITFPCTSVSVSLSKSFSTDWTPNFSARASASIGSNADKCDIGLGFEFDIVFPCTSMSVSPSYSFKTSWTPSFSVSAVASLSLGSTCDIGMNMLFDIVFPCTSVSVSTSAIIVQAFDSPSLSVTGLTSLSLGDTCDVGLGLLFDIRVPCTSLSFSTSNVIMLGQGLNYETIILTNAGKTSPVCEWDLGVQYQLYLPCQSTSLRSKSVSHLRITGAPTLEVVFDTHTEDGGSRCATAFDIYQQAPMLSGIYTNIETGDYIQALDFGLTAENYLSISANAGAFATTVTTGDGCAIGEAGLLHTGGANPSVWLSVSKTWCKYC